MTEAPVSNRAKDLKRLPETAKQWESKPLRVTKAANRVPVERDEEPKKGG